MDVKVLNNNNLEWEFEVSVPAQDVLRNVEETLLEKQKEIKIPGFRDGKAPIAMVKKKVGAEVLTSEIEKHVDNTLRALFDERDIRPAMQPQVEITNFDEKGTLTFTVKVEQFPSVPEVDWSQIELENLIINVGEEDMKKAHNDIIKNFKNFSPASDNYSAKKGDAVIIDFVGKVNDKEFDGGKGESIRLELGSKQFIPGFEDQLVGAKKGAHIKVRVAFPKNYTNKDLAGKPAVFDVTIKEILQPEGIEGLNDEFAKQLGVESLDALNELIKHKIQSDFSGIARLRLKKMLFDQVDSVYKFEIPKSMFQLDFDAMWADLKAQKEANPQAFKGKTEADLRAEYTEIAKRRVRLGILLADIARQNNIEITQDDLNQAILNEAMMRPGQEKIVLDFYSKEENLERLKGPILEEKAVDFILKSVKQKDVEITSQEFFEKYAEDLNPGNSDEANK